MYFPLDLFGWCFSSPPALSWKLTRYRATLLAMFQNLPETLRHMIIDTSPSPSMPICIYTFTVTVSHIIYTYIELLSSSLAPKKNRPFWSILTHIVFVSAPLHICFLFFGTLSSARLAWKFPMPCSFWVFSSLSGLWKKWVPWRPEI